eukprot:SAG11_NODE_1043_length_6052_cov_7.005711_3_plen_217_part_00
MRHKQYRQDKQERQDRQGDRGATHLARPGTRHVVSSFEILNGIWNVECNNHLVVVILIVARAREVFLQHVCEHFINICQIFQQEIGIHIENMLQPHSKLNFVCTTQLKQSEAQRHRNRRDRAGQGRGGGGGGQCLFPDSVPMYWGLSSDRLAHVMDDAMVAAGIPAEFRPYSARHAGLAHMKELGHSDDEVMARANMSARTCVTYYRRKVRRLDTG